MSTSSVVSGAQRGDLRGERGRLAVVQQGEGVRGGAGGRDAVAAARLQVGGRGEAGQVGGPRGGHRGLLVGASPAHLDQRPAVRGADHPGRGRGDRAVVVEDRQHQRLQQHRLGEAAAHGEQRRAGEVQLALRVAVDVAGEPVVGQPVQGGRGRPRRLERRQLVVAEPEPARSRRAAGRCRPTTP